MDIYREDDDDIRLVRLSLQGDREAFRSLVKRYERSVFYFCLSGLHDPEEAEDAAQEVFLRAYVSLKTFSLDRRFKTWLFTIAANRIRSRGRVSSFLKEKIKKYTRSLKDAPVTDPGRNAEKSLEAEGIRAAVERLPPKYKACVYLYYFEDLPVAETAKALSIGEEAVKTRLFRARKLLRKNLEEFRK